MSVSNQTSIVPDWSMPDNASLSLPFPGCIMQPQHLNSDVVKLVGLAIFFVIGATINLLVVLMLLQVENFDSRISISGWKSFLGYTVWAVGKGTSEFIWM